ncbi:MAG: MmgE/PrpD family protein, partial [Streptosporangiaceae bacterium]
ALASSSRRSGSTLSRWLELEDQPDGRHLVLGLRRRMIGTVAATVNGTLMHAEDWDDSPHTSYYFPALLAAAERNHSSGRDLIVAWVAAYEVWGSVLPALVPDRQLNPTSVIAPIAAAVGAGLLYRLSGLELRYAIGIAAAASSGIRANFGTDTKGLDAGRSAAAGLLAVQLASAGWDADESALEGFKGFFDCFGGPGADPARGADGLGTQYRSAVVPADPAAGGYLDPATWPPAYSPKLARRPRPAPAMVPARTGGRGSPTVKAWPCCLGANAALTLLFSLVRQHGIRPGDITEIEVTVPRELRNTAMFRDPPRTGLEAKFSLPYVIASAWADGDVTLDSFQSAAFQLTMAAGRMEAVRIVTDPEMAGRGESGRVEVRTRDGLSQSLTGTGLGLHLLPPAITQKFTASALESMSAADAAAVARAVWAMEDLGSLDEITGPLGP